MIDVGCFTCYYSGTTWIEGGTRCNTCGIGRQPIGTYTPYRLWVPYSLSYILKELIDE